VNPGVGMDLCQNFLLCIGRGQQKADSLISNSNKMSKGIGVLKVNFEFKQAIWPNI
jgi:hypothetical protein